MDDAPIPSNWKPRDRLILTARQEDRLDMIPDGYVIGHEDECPVVRLANGRIMKVSKQGRIVHVKMDTRDAILERQISRWEREP